MTRFKLLAAFFVVLWYAICNVMIAQIRQRTLSPVGIPVAVLATDCIGFVLVVAYLSYCVFRDFGGAR